MVSIYFGVDDAQAICKIDNVNLDSDFIAANKLQVRLALNTYIALLKGDLGVAEGDLYTIKLAFKTYGLASVVRACQDLAESLMMGFADYSSLDHFGIDYDKLIGAIAEPGKPILRGLYNVHIANRTCAGKSYISWNTSGEAAAVLQALLFLERFTYRDKGSDLACFQKFMGVNNKCRMITNNWKMWPGETIMWMVRSALEKIYTRRNYRYRIEDCHFSTGSTTDSSRSKGQIGKWQALCATETCYMRDLTMPLPGGQNLHRKDETRYPRLTAVPKKLTSKRCIAPEDASCNYFAMGALEALRNMLTLNGTMAYINERDQSVNRKFAEMGSRPDGGWSTIDMSSASDSIVRALFMALIPEWYRPVITEYASDYFVVDLGNKPETRRMFTLFTSGNPLTWLTESTYFLAIARVACSLCGLKGYDVAYVYGDDIIIKTEAYETCCDLLECFGHTVNRRKSYGTGDFRESCGGWYYHGHDVTPVFWPRHELVQGAGTVAPIVRDLVALQHNLMASGLDSAAQQVAKQAKELYRGLTVSAYGSNYQDLWSREVSDALDGLRPHTAFSQEYKVVKRNPLIDHILYYQYLQFGPSYENKLDELLGISSSRVETMYKIVGDDVKMYTVIPDNGTVVDRANGKNEQKSAPAKKTIKQKPTEAKTSGKPVAPAKQAVKATTPSKGRKVDKGGKPRPTPR